MWDPRRLTAQIKVLKQGQQEHSILLETTTLRQATKSESMMCPQATRLHTTSVDMQASGRLPGKKLACMPLEPVLCSTPRNRAPFTPEQMRERQRELQDARARRDGEPQAPGPSRRPSPTPRPPAMPSVPRVRRTSDLDIFGQLGATPAKLTVGTLLQEAPR